MEVERIRALVRPVVAIIFAAAFVVAAFINDTAADHLKEFTAAIIGAYFVIRTVEKKS